MSYRPERIGSGDRGSRDSRERRDSHERRGSSDSRTSARMERRDSGSSSGGSRKVTHEGRRDSGERRASAGSGDSSPKPRDENELPTAFGRVGVKSEETDLDILQRMSKSFINAPLGNLTRHIQTDRKIKIWTRDFKAVRGICVGYIVAFDKHWNLVMQDVNEAYMRPKRNKTPFLSDLESASRFEELPPKVCKPKKKQEEIQEPPDVKPEIGAKKAKKKRKKKKRKIARNRHVKQIFIRGDNIVMLSVLPKED